MPTDFFLERDALVGHDALLRDACPLGGFAGRDFGLLEIAGALDLEAAVLFFHGNAGARDRQFLGDTRPFGLFARPDLGMLDVTLALDLAPLVVFLAGDPGLGDDALLRDAGALDALVGGDLGLVDLPAALDLALTDFAFRVDPRLGDGALMRDAGLLHLLATGELRLFSLGVAQRALARQLGALHRAPHFDVAFLVEARGLALAIDFKRLFLCFEVAGADQDHRILLDVVAHLAAGFDVLDQFGQALGVEPVRRIEKLEVGLIEIGDRDGFEFEAVLLEAFERRVLDTRDVFAAPFVHLHHGHFRGDRPQRGNELAGQQRIEFAHIHGAPAERGGGDGNGFAGRRHADVKFGLDVDAHAVLGDQRILAVAHHLHPQHVHVHRRHFVNERKDEGAAVDDDFFAEQAGAHEGDFLRRAPVQPVDEIDDDRDDDDRDDQPDDQTAKKSTGHLTSSPPADHRSDAGFALNCAGFSQSS